MLSEFKDFETFLSDWFVDTVFSGVFLQCHDDAICELTVLVVGSFVVVLFNRKCTAC